MSPVKYSISDLERLSGVKAHTIRMWEKRYGIIQPDRTDTNIRFYSDNDLQKLLNISLLNQHGIKISHIAEMSEVEIITEVSNISDQSIAMDADVNSMVMAAIELHEDKFDRVLNSCLLKIGFENTFCHVIFPLFEKLSILWQIGRINACQERFISNLVRQKLMVATDGLAGNIEALKGSYLLFMPVNHDNEIGLLFANYLLRRNKYQVVYLGSSVPLDHLQRLQNREKYQDVFLSLNLAVGTEELVKYLAQLRNIFPNQTIHLVPVKGQTYKINLPDINIYPDFESFSRVLSK